MMKNVLIGAGIASGFLLLTAAAAYLEARVYEIAEEEADKEAEAEWKWPKLPKLPKRKTLVCKPKFLKSYYCKPES